MPEVTVHTFISSTWLDLRPERRSVEAALQRMREVKFAGMEYFGSRDETTAHASLDEVDRSQLYVAIIGGRYGSGITEEEYRRASGRKLPCFIYFKNEATIAAEWREKEQAQVERLAAFKSEIRRNHLISEFSSPDDLAAKVTADLHRWLFDQYLTPRLTQAAQGSYPRGDAQALLDAIKDLSGLSASLRAQLQSGGFTIAQTTIISGDNITNIGYQLPHAAAPLQVRAAVTDFVGREREIETLINTLRRGGRAAITGISGMGGIGKTELALVVAERLRDDFPDQLMVDLLGTSEKPRTPAEALEACIRALSGQEGKLPEALDQLTSLYHASLSGKRALILLDNAADHQQVRPLMPPQGCALLITSRRALSLPGMTPMTLEQLGPTEARELLMGTASHVSADVADQICYLCGYLPLAIRAAGSLLAETIDLDPADYVVQLRDERRRLKALKPEDVSLSVEASFNLSYARLSEETALVFRKLAVFPASFDAAAEETVCQDSRHALLSELLRRNLVMYDRETKRYRLHDLARLFAASRLGEDERATVARHHAEYFKQVLSAAHDLYLRGGEEMMRGLGLYDKERNNIEAGQAWAETQAGANDEAAGLCVGYAVGAPYVLNLRQHPREFIRWLEAALGVTRRLKQRQSEGVALTNLGLAYISIGDMHKAIEYLEQRLVIAQEVGDRRGEGYGLGNLGLAYWRLGDSRKAIEYYEQTLLISRESEDMRSEGNALGNLGNAHSDLGDARKAIEYYEQALMIDRRIGDRRGEAIDLWNLSLELNSLGLRDQAIARAQESLTVREQIEDPRADMVRKQLDEWMGQQES